MPHFNPLPKKGGFSASKCAPFLHRCMCLLFAAVLVLPLGGCGKKDAVIRYDIPTGTRNLDPQFTTDVTASVVIYNIFEGLLRQTSTGEIVPAAAEGYTISADGKTYTFTLRPNMRWEDETPVTAADFEFALKRMFNPIAPSAHAQRYLSIQNAGDILAGHTTADRLGVRATSANTLEINLEYADPFFPETLTHSSAMPCNQAFFEKCKGRYGMALATTNANGPFYLKYWDNKTSLNLRKNNNYYDADAVVTNGVNLYIGRTAPPPVKDGDSIQEQAELSNIDLLLEGKTDSAKASYEQVQLLQEKGYAATGFQDTVWCLLFNVQSPLFQNKNLRDAFGYAIDRDGIAQTTDGNFSVATRFVPPSVTLLGQPYSTTVPMKETILYSSDHARALLEASLAELELSKLPPMELLVGIRDGVSPTATYLQQMWQKELGAFPLITEMPMKELEARVQEGDFDFALIPLTSDFSAPSDVFLPFATANTRNLLGYSNPDFDAALQQAFSSHNGDNIAQYYLKAEQLLREDAVVTPLWYQTTYFVQAKNVTGIEFFPDIQKTYFKAATRSA